MIKDESEPRHPEWEAVSLSRESIWTKLYQLQLDSSINKGILPNIPNRWLGTRQRKINEVVIMYLAYTCDNNNAYNPTPEIGLFRRYRPEQIDVIYIANGKIISICGSLISDVEDYYPILKELKEEGHFEKKAIDTLERAIANYWLGPIFP